MTGGVGTVRRALLNDLPRIHAVRRGTGSDTQAVGFYGSLGWQATGVDLKGHTVFRHWL